MRLALSMPTMSSVGEWKISSALRRCGDAVDQHLLGDVVEEFAADAERPPGERHLDLALLADLGDLAPEQAGDMGGVARRGDRHHRARFGNAVRGRQHRRAAEAVADQERGRVPASGAMVGGGDQVGDIGGKVRVGELAVAAPSPVKSKRSTAMPSAVSRSAMRLAACTSLPQVKQCANSAKAGGSPAGRSSTAASFSPLHWENRSARRAWRCLAFPRHGRA